MVLFCFFLLRKEERRLADHREDCENPGLAVAPEDGGSVQGVKEQVSFLPGCGARLSGPTDARGLSPPGYTTALSASEPVHLTSGGRAVS